MLESLSGADMILNKATTLTYMEHNIYTQRGNKTKISAYLSNSVSNGVIRHSVISTEGLSILSVHENVRNK